MEGKVLREKAEVEEHWSHTYLLFWCFFCIRWKGSTREVYMCWRKWPSQNFGIAFSCYIRDILHDYSISILRKFFLQFRNPITSICQRLRHDIPNPQRFFILCSNSPLFLYRVLQSKFSWSVVVLFHIIRPQLQPMSRLSFSILLSIYD